MLSIRNKERPLEQIRPKTGRVNNFHVCNLFDAIMITVEQCILAILVRKQGPLKIKNLYDDLFTKYRDHELESCKNRQGKKVMGLKKVRRKGKFRDFII